MLLSLLLSLDAVVSSTLELAVRLTRRSCRADVTTSVLLSEYPFMSVLEDDDVAVMMLRPLFCSLSVLFMLFGDECSAFVAKLSSG